MWETVTLGNVATVIAGQSPTGENYNKEGQGMPFYQGKKDYGDKFLKPPTVWTKSVTKVAVEGDILMSVRAPVGALNIATQEICIGRGLAAIRVNTEIDKDYLFYALAQISDGLIGSSGAIFNSINKKSIENIELPLPPLAEQQRIVAKLDAAFAEIDKAVLATDYKIQNLINVRENAISGEFSSNNDRERKSFAEVCTLQRGFDLPKSKRNSGTYPLYSANGITDFIDEYKIEAPGVITGRSGTIGQVHYTNERFWALNTALYVKDFKGNFQKYIFYFLKSFNLKSFASGAGVPTLNRNVLSEEIVHISTNIQEQKRVFERLDAIGENLIELNDIFTKKRENILALKSAILAQELQSEAA